LAASAAGTGGAGVRRATATGASAGGEAGGAGGPNRISARAMIGSNAAPAPDDSTMMIRPWPDGAFGVESAGGGAIGRIGVCRWYDRITSVASKIRIGGTSTAESPRRYSITTIGDAGEGAVESSAGFESSAFIAKSRSSRMRSSAPSVFANVVLPSSVRSDFRK
jgi:hypothetical protein